MSPFKTKNGSEWPVSFSAFLIGPAVPRGFFGGSSEYFTVNPLFGIRCCLTLYSVSWLTARIASLTLFLANRSKIHWSNGLLTIGKRVLGLVQLSGLNLVPNPPARHKGFINAKSPCCQAFIHSF